MATSTAGNNIPGHNQATYGPIPQSEQLFEIETFEVSPLPVPVDQVFFTLLRGYIPKAKAKALGIDDAALTKATVTVTRSVVYPDGQHRDFGSGTIPLRTFGTFAAHLAIRNSNGTHVDYLTIGEPGGMNDIVTDMWILSQFLEAGNWTFEFVAEIPDKTCLFAFTFTQWLQGKLERISAPSAEHGEEAAGSNQNPQSVGKEKVQ